jgi:hypothetical protein
VLEPAAHVGNQVWNIVQPFGMPEHDARPLLLEMEQVHLAAELAVVALLGFFQHVQIVVELAWSAQAVP